MTKYEVTEIISYIFADSEPSIRHLQTLFGLRQYYYSGPESTGRLHCPLLNYLYRHKFTIFVIQT